jgi:hypothetical protein
LEATGMQVLDDGYFGIPEVTEVGYGRATDRIQNGRRGPFTEIF